MVGGEDEKQASRTATPTPSVTQPASFPSLPSYSTADNSYNNDTGNDVFSMSTEMIIETATTELDAYENDEMEEVPIGDYGGGTNDSARDDDSDIADITRATRRRYNFFKGCCSNSNNKKWTFSSLHSKFVSTITYPLVHSVLFLSKSAATHPLKYVTLLPLVAMILMAVGFFTNFNQVISTDVWTPVTSMAVKHGEWIKSEESGFPNDARVATLIIHANGNNVLGDNTEGNDSNSNKAKEGLEHVFEALNTIRSIPGYTEMCSHGYYTTTNPISNEVSCFTLGVSLMYYDDYDYFVNNAASDEDVVQTLSSPKYPNGLEVDRERIIGNNRFTQDEDGNEVLEYAESYVSFISLPGEDDVYEDVMKFETEMIDQLLQLKQQWESSPDSNYFTLELIAPRSFEDEFQRVIIVDLPLIILSALLMTTLCIIVFHKHGDKVHSRKWLGLGAVVTVFFSVMASYGLLFCVGVPFTNLTPMVPFIVFGVGLDDTFIIFGSYLRMEHDGNGRKFGNVERVEKVMKEVAPAIILTTLTSATAFALGLISSIPAVKYLVYYAFTSILVDFFFQVTFFIALIVLDERRIQANRLDCCFCCTAGGSSDDDSMASGKSSSSGYDQKRHFSTRVMASYGKWLLKRPISMAVIVVFVAMFGVFAWSTTQLTQYFEFTQVIPQDSYIQTWWTSWTNLYSANGAPAGIYFRDVDFSDPEIQSQMKSYVQELADSPYVGGYPERFWLEDLETYVNTLGLQNLSFEEQLDSFLGIPAVNDLYGSEIIRDESGKVTSSRTYIRLDNLVEATVQEKIEFVHAEREITSSQEVNQGLEEWKFFTWSDRYYIFEFYSTCPQEFATSTIIGVVSVTVLALLFIPYWPCALITGVSIAMLNIDLLGFMQFLDVMISPMSYILCIMSIGLMVDHVMHVTVRYMEIAGKDRKQRTQETLETMGASILLGGVSTLFGVLPLIFASSEAFRIVFVIFFGVVSLGVLHGLMFLPAVLSFIGPLGSISRETDDDLHKGISKDSWSSQCGTVVGSSKDDLSESTAASPTDLAHFDDDEERGEEQLLSCEEADPPPAAVPSSDDYERKFIQMPAIGRESSHDGSPTAEKCEEVIAMQPSKSSTSRVSSLDGSVQTAEKSKYVIELQPSKSDTSRVSSRDGSVQTAEKSKDEATQPIENGTNSLVAHESVEVIARNAVEGFMNSVNDLLCFA